MLAKSPTCAFCGVQFNDTNIGYKNTISHGFNVSKSLFLQNFRKYNLQVFSNFDCLQSSLKRQSSLFFIVRSLLFWPFKTEYSLKKFSERTKIKKLFSELIFQLDVFALFTKLMKSDCLFFNCESSPFFLDFNSISIRFTFPSTSSILSIPFYPFFHLLQTWLCYNGLIHSYR